MQITGVVDYKPRRRLFSSTKSGISRRNETLGIDLENDHSWATFYM